MCWGEPAEVSNCAMRGTCPKLKGGVGVGVCWVVPFQYIATGRCNDEEILFSLVTCDVS